MSVFGFSTTLQAQPSPVGMSGSWNLVFSDEFENAELDKSKWTTCYWWDDGGCTNLSSKEKQWYLPENVVVGAGQLRLNALEKAVTGFRGRKFHYTSGIVTTGRYYRERSGADRFGFKYGFVEVRAKAAIGQGLWTGIWMLPSNHSSTPEIDIMEVLGHAPRVREIHYHYGNDKSVGSEAPIPGALGSWQTYAVDWSPDAIVWYLNGVEQWRYTDKARISKVPMYLLINLAVGGTWPGDPDDTTVFPAKLLVDYVRIWQKSNG